MTGYLGKTTNGFGYTVGGAAQDEREDLLGAMPGEVVAYHPERGTVDVQPLFKKWEPSARKNLDYPVLLEVPLDMPRSGNSAITHPVPAGTRVMLTPMMRSGENYETEDEGAPSDRRSFNLSDMRASLAGGDSLSSPLPNVDPDNTHIRFDADGRFGIRGSQEGKIKIEGSEGDIYALIGDAIDQTQQGFDFLSTEPTLEHVAEYGAIAAQLSDILAKLRAMAL